MDKTKAELSITDAPGYRAKDSRNCAGCQFYQSIEGKWDEGTCQKFEFETSCEYLCDAFEERTATPIAEPMPVVIVDPDAALAASQRGEIVALALPTLSPDKPGQTLTLQVLRIGDFTDMHGLDLQISAADLDTYIANSKVVLSAREIPIEVGHPTDPGAPAAAWYRDFFRQTIDGVEWICAKVELSALGVKSLADQLYKYFSASLDLSHKKIIGGGFVNRPAVSGQMPVGSLAAPTYLQPRKISTGGTNPMEVSAELEAQLTQVREEERAKLLAQQADFEVKLAAAREDERARVLAEVGRTEEIRKLSAQLTSGPKAFWHKPAELEALLAQLTDDDRKVVGDLLLQVQTKGLVDLGERGHSHADAGVRLTDEAQVALQAHLRQGGSVETFFAANPELGNAAQYANIESK